MKSRIERHQELRQRILNLSDVTERQDAGIHEDAFFVAGKMFMHHAMNRSGVRRLLILSAAAHFPGIPKRIVSFILRNHMRDSLAMEKVVQDSGLDWTIARPPRLTREQYATYRSREGAAPRRGFSLSRKAVAAFMLDAIEQKKHFQKIVGIAK